MFRRIHMAVFSFAALVVSIASLTHFNAALAQQPAPIKIGMLGALSDVPLLIAEREGYFKAEGLKIETIPFKSGAQLVAPLGTGQIDVAAGVVAAGLNNLSVRGVDLKIVSDRGSMSPGHGYMSFLVRKDLVDSGKYKTYADLKGMKVGSQSKGGAAESTLNELLKLGGLKFSDVDITYLGHAELAVALGSKAIDASFVTEPYATLAVNQGSAVRIVTGDKIYPNQVLGMLAYGGSFIKDRPDVAVKFMKAFLRGCRLYNAAYDSNGKFIPGPTAEKVKAAYKSIMDLKDDRLLDEIVPSGCDVDGKLNIAGMKKDYEFFKQRGLIQGEVNIELLIDMTFAERAASELAKTAQTR
ncbi:MAG: ABC transporter substrate-binding protein [Zoogloeaceae bacterium]|nr:ABC transporter substrate-binding protein [Zoogloeaceae bacterium]